MSAPYLSTVILTASTQVQDVTDGQYCSAGGRITTLLKMSNRACQSGMGWICAALLLLVPMAAMAIEEPGFDLLEKDQNVEIRQYRPFIVAETFVDGNMDAASSAGFRLIADYIFGNNQVKGTPEGKASEKIAMTAPVTMEPVATSRKIAMTAPVTVEPQGRDAGKTAEPDRWRVHFVMPSVYSLASLPKPNNPAVMLREVPGKRYAALVFSGLAGDEKVREKTGELLGWTNRRDFRTVGTPQLARYNPPWTPPFLRRNEILVEIAVPSGDRVEMPSK